MVFLPNYNVSLAETIIPAADLSEQISTAGMEASGTGNMKLALNGALTIGTLDGANVEIKEQVGDDNIFIFGLTAAEVEASRAKGIDAREAIAGEPAPRRGAASGRARASFRPTTRNRYAQLVDTLTYYDYFLVSTDFDAYWDAQALVDARWRDQKAWRRSTILNTARVGLVFLRPHDPGICAGDLERAGLSRSESASPDRVQFARDNAALARRRVFLYRFAR